MSENKMVSLENFYSKERASNFSRHEVERLQSLVTKYKHIILCKKTDGTSSKQKENIWGCIVKEFNAIGETPRTLKQLKYKFDNMKRALKKEASTKRQKMIKTGGGRLTPSPPLSTGQEIDSEWLRSVMSISIDGNEAIYDDDVILEPLKIIQDVSLVNEENKDLSTVEKPLKIVQDETLVNEETKDLSTVKKIDKSERKELLENTLQVFEASSPHSSLKRPVSSPLKRLMKKKKITNDGCSIKSVLDERKLMVLNELHELEIKKLKESIIQQKEKHNLELKKLDLEIEILKYKKNKIETINSQ